MYFWESKESETLQVMILIYNIVEYFFYYIFNTLSLILLSFISISKLKFNIFLIFQ